MGARKRSDKQDLIENMHPNESLHLSDAKKFCLNMNICNFAAVRGRWHRCRLIWRNRLSLAPMTEGVYYLHDICNY